MLHLYKEEETIWQVPFSNALFGKPKVACLVVDLNDIHQHRE